MKSVIMAFALSVMVMGCDSGSPAKESMEASGPAKQQDRAALQQQDRVAISVTGSGYQPASIKARAGERLVLVFKRTTEQGCGKEIVFPERNIRQALPLNEEVEIAFIPKTGESIAFTCGMGMYRGLVVAVTS